MRDLNYGIRKLVMADRRGSYSTRAARWNILHQAAKQLHALGFRNMKPNSLKPKHVENLVARWKEEHISDATMKNRMSHLRWWAETIGKPGLIAKDNSHYGINQRSFVATFSKATTLDRLEKINDPYIRLSLELQRAFGLRREEAIKFKPSYADKGDKIQLKASWTKGGRPREIPVRNTYQREILNRAHNLVKTGSLIPPDKRYIDQLRTYERHTTRAGMDRNHGLRHAYAQERYQELTGRLAPSAGGSKRNELSNDEKQQDYQVRMQISKELGHGREEITAAYLGR